MGEDTDHSCELFVLRQRGSTYDGPKEIGTKKSGTSGNIPCPTQKLEVYFKENVTIAALSFRLINLSAFNALTA